MKEEQIDCETLLQGVNNRDEGYVAAFHDRVFPKLFKRARRYLEDVNARDIVTDEFVKLLKEGKTFNTLAHIERLLLMRVGWASKDLLKSRRTGKVIHITFGLDEESFPENPDEKNAAEEEAALSDLDNWIREALEGLSPRERQILELYFYKGMTCPEIARILKVKDSLVYNIKDRAIKRLRAVYADKYMLIILLLFLPPN